MEFIKDNKIKILILSLTTFVANLISLSISPLYHPRIRQSDANLYMLIGKGISQGLVPYKDLPDYKGPILFYLYQFLSIFGSSQLFPFIFISLSLLSATIIIFFELSQKIPSQKAFLITLISISFITLLQIQGLSINSSNFYFLLYAIAFYYAYKAKNPIFLGVIIGVIFWVKYYDLLLIFPILIYSMITKKYTFKYILKTFFSFLGVTISVIVISLLEGNLVQMIKIYFFGNKDRVHYPLSINGIIRGFSNFLYEIFPFEKFSHINDVKISSLSLRRTLLLVFILLFVIFMRKKVVAIFGLSFLISGILFYVYDSPYNPWTGTSIFNTYYSIFIIFSIVSIFSYIEKRPNYIKISLISLIPLLIVSLGVSFFDQQRGHLFFDNRTKTSVNNSIPSTISNENSYKFICNKYQNLQALNYYSLWVANHCSKEISPLDQEILLKHISTGGQLLNLKNVYDKEKVYIFLKNGEETSKKIKGDPRFKLIETFTQKQNKTKDSTIYIYKLI